VKPVRWEEVVESFPAEEFRRASEVRRDLHRHPELAFEEIRTSKVVRGELESIGLSPHSPVGRTGVTADFGSSGSPRLMIRADMDALPLDEENDTPYRSETRGKMHACGHDGHVAIGLAVARRLSENPGRAAFRSLFQPAEEGAGGAEAVIRDGALEGIAGAVGLHLWNQLPVGKIGVVEGAQMAAVDDFEIVVSGPGGHGAAPHETADPILAAARIIEGLQSIVSREISPLESAVVTVASVHGGTAFNIIPREVRLSGTARSFAPEVWRALPEKITRIVKGLSAACGVDATVDYRRFNRATVNDSESAGIVARAAEEILGREAVVEARTMGGEDMSVFLDRVPGCFFFVGSAPEGQHRPHHSPVFDFDERALSIGTLVLEEAARRLADALSASP
jgi:amidohydrolase